MLLYLFIWSVVRSVTRDLRSAPQESIVLSAQEANELRSRYEPVVQAPVARMLVLESPALQVGSTVELKVPTRLGRGGENAIRLDGDDFVSTRHALLEPRPDGLWVEDVGSTNGTFVNGARVTTARLLTAGDIVRIGQTDLQGRGMRTGRASALTDTGRRRPQNEDTFVCEPPLFAVADGVGGAQAGEIASRLAAAALEERLTDALGEETLAELIQTANDRIYRHSLDDPAAAGMGTVDDGAARRRGLQATSPSATSGIPAPTGCGTACSSSSRPITRSSASSSAPGGSRRRRPRTIRTDR